MVQGGHVMAYINGYVRLCVCVCTVMDVLISEIGTNIHRMPVALRFFNTDGLSGGNQEMIFMICAEMLASIAALQHYKHTHTYSYTRTRSDLSLAE